MEGDQVSPKSAAVLTVPIATIPIPSKSAYPVAGPSSEGAVSGNLLDASPPAFAPSSAPPTPSVVSLTHPSQFIHTHHPRRGSLTPLGLNVISPVAPALNGSPVRSVGFNPQYDASGVSPRRDSVHSNSSILSSSRPHASTSHRRSSLTPSISTLAPPSPTKALASGRLSSRPTSSDGRDAPPMHARTRTSETAITRGSPLGNDGRRGSLPQLYSGGGQRWNPSLPTQRGSVDADVDQGFKFGSGPPSRSEDEPMLLASRRLSQMSNRRKDDMSAFEEAEQEEAERQRRAFLDATYGGDGKRARERLSLGGPNLASPLASPGSPGGGGMTRRQSLMLWERLSMASGPTPPPANDAGPTSAPPLFTRSASSTSEDFGQRRGSLPIAIPGNGLNRTSSRPSRHSPDDPMQSNGAEDEDEDVDESLLGGPVRPLPPLLPLSDPGPRLLPSTLALQRASHLLTSRNLESAPLPAPLPPSLHPPAPVDLSEFDIDFILAGSKSQLGREKSKRSSPNGGSSRQTPVMRGSEDEDTFAKFVGAFDDEYGDRRGEWTFRACPPRAADVFPFDSESGAPVVEVQKSVSLPKAEWESPGAGRYQHYPTGEVHAEQSGRVWRIRKSSSREYELEQLASEPPLEQTPLATVTDVDNQTPFASSVPPTIDDPYATVIASNGNVILTSKLAHTEHGGVKLPIAVQREYSKRNRRTSRLHSSTSATAPLPDFGQRGSVSDSLTESTRTVRKASSDSTATNTPQASSVPRLPRPSFGSSLPNPLAGAGVPAPRDDSSGEERGRVQFARDVHDTTSSKIRDKSNTRSRSKDRSASGASDKDKDKKGLNVLKRGLFASIKDSKLVKDYEERKERREEKERERAQSQSWSGGSSASSHWSVAGSKNDYQQHQHVHSVPSAAPPQGSSSREYLPPPSGPERSASTSTSSYSGHSGHSHSTLPTSTSIAVNDEPTPGVFGDDEGPFGSLGLGIEDEQNGGMPWKEGAAWSVVPDEAVAMVIPLERAEGASGGERTSGEGSRPGDDGLSVPARPMAKAFVNPFFTDGPAQALLVWFVPFNAEVEPSRTSLPRIDEQVATPPSTSTGATPDLSSSLGNRLPKILRRRASKDREGLRAKGSANANAGSTVPEHLQPPDFDFSSSVACVLQPIPFKSFRIVAKVVHVADLQSAPEIPIIAFDVWQEQRRRAPGIAPTGSGSHGLLSVAAANNAAGGSSHNLLSSTSAASSSSLPTSVSSLHSMYSAHSSLPPTPPAPQAGTTPVAAPTAPKIAAGRAFPTVIGVCHSRTQGVEFVLEGLDRLGLCKGESAWGPTGYEEWRGTGLSDKGRELLDLLWTACAVVMGL